MSEMIETALDWYSEMIRSESAGGVILALATLALFIATLIGVAYYGSMAIGALTEKAYHWLRSKKK